MPDHAPRAPSGGPRSAPGSYLTLSPVPVSSSALSFSDARQLALDPAIALLLQLQRQLFTTGPDDTPTRENMHEVRNDIVEQPLVVRDDDEGALRAAQGVDPVGDDFEGIDVQARIGL